MLYSYRFCRAHIICSLNMTKSRTAILNLLDSTLLESLPDPTLIVDANGVIVRVNRQVHKLFGYELGELIGQELEILVPENARKIHAQHRADFIANPKTRLMGLGMEMALQCRAKDGTSFLVEISLSPIETKDDRLVIATMRDVTERKRTQHKLEVRANLFRLMTDAAEHANQANSLDEAIEYCLERICAYLGWSIGHAYKLKTDGAERLVSAGIWYLSDPEGLSTFRQITEKTEFDRGIGLPGRVWKTGRPAWIEDVTKDPNFPRAKLADDIGVRTGLALPIRSGSNFMGALEFFTKEVLEPDEPLLQMLAQIGLQLGQVAERVRAQAALQQHTELLNNILESSPIAATIVNADATFEFVNSRALEMWGVSKEEFLASNARDLYVDPNDRDKIFERLSKQRSLRDIEVQFKNKGDTPFWALVSLEPTGLGDQPQYFTWIYDITGRKEAEEELRQSEQRLQAIFETSPIGVAIVNRDGTWAFVNSRLVEMLGTSREKFLASNARDLYVNPNERDRIYERLLECGHLHDVEIQVKRADGTSFWVMVSLEPTEKGNQSQHFAWVNDITERKKAEDALRSSKEEAEAALENLKKTQAQLVHSQRLASLGELTAGIAHEIKNPLNFVNNFAETSLELIEELREQIEQAGDRFDGKTRENLDDLSGALKEDLGTINIHGRRADGIVKSMLLHAQADGSDRVEAALNPLVSEALNLAYHGARAKDKSFQVTLEEELADTTGAAEVAPQAITRVLLNLIGNAFYAVKKRAKEAGDENYQPTVSVATRGRGDRIKILVRDNGIGISKDIQEKLFEPFFTTKPPGEGTGLGLSICYDIVVQRHGGQMAVDSKMGEFTEFSIELPRHSGKIATRHKNPEAG